VSVAEIAPRSDDFERTPPHDVAAEQCALGGMLLSKDAISDVIEVLRPTDHYRPAHQLIHEAILDLYGRGEPADAITVANELTRRGEIARVGGGPYLHTLIASVPTAANAGYYARIVRERAILRRLVEAGTRIVQFGYAGDADADDLVDRAQAEVYAVTERRVGEDYHSLSEIMPGALDEIEAIGSHGGVLTGVPTGFSDLDALTNGLHPGQMIVIAARPAVGKALALDTPLPTPTGWTTMGEVRVGDHLMGADGKPTRVVAATEVMHGRPCYELEFDDASRINPNGGACALGHPVGASGARLVGTAALELGRRKGRFALATICGGMGQGAATISATSNSISSSTSITVGQATLSSIAVTPSSIAVSLGYGEQFTATATYSNGSTQDITQSATWASSVPLVATVDGIGFAFGGMQGTTNISATYMNASASGVLMIIPPALLSISVTPGSSLVTTGNSVQLTATAGYSDGSTQNVTSSATWSTSVSTIATVNAGLLTGIAGGTVTVTASASGITSTAVTVQVGIPSDFYVATNGSDSWSGTLFTPNSANTDGPFATVGKAQSTVQTLLRNPQGRTNPITVLLRGGSYYAQSLAFSSADSGTSTLPVVWQNYPNEIPILSGGIRVTGWTNTGSNAYQLSLPTNTLYFENLFYNGQRRLRPRTGGYLGAYGRIAASIFMAGAPPPATAPNSNCSVYVTGKGWECFDRFQANCSDINRSWQNLNPPYPVGDIELIDFEFWTDSKLRIQSIDQSCVIFLTGPTPMTLPGHGFIPNHRYIVENVKDSLSLPGQWFLDRSRIGG